MSTITRSRAALILLGAAATILTGCSDDPLVGPSRSAPLAPSRPARSIALSSEASFMLSAEVTGKDLETPFIYNMPLAGGLSDASLAIPAGEYREVVVRAHDQYGNVTHEGSLSLYDVQVGENKPASVTLKPVGDGKEIEAAIDVVGEKPIEKSSLVIVSKTTEIYEGRMMKLRAYLVDPDGVRRSVDPNQVHWSVSDLRAGHMLPPNEKDEVAFILTESKYDVIINANLSNLKNFYRPKPLRNPYVDITAGQSHSCAVRMLGDAYCWGYNTSSQLGSPAVATCGPTQACADRATIVQGGKLWRMVSAGAYHTCAVDLNNVAFCWGQNDDGQLGDATVGGGVYTTVPQPVPGKTFRSVSAGLYHSCGIDLNGTAWCWGSNWAAELGNARATGNTSTPQQVVGGQNWAQINASFWHTCARDVNSATFCWGSNQHLELGHATPHPWNSPARDSVPRLTDNTLHSIDISRGVGSHNCFAAQNGGNFCWGDNGADQTGTGSNTNVATPTALIQAPQFTSFATGTGHTCAVSNTNVAFCWGGNWKGQLGDGTSNDRPTATAVSTTLSFSRVAAGMSHSCGLTTTGQVWCWGDNMWGQLGNGTHGGNSTTPVQVIQ